MKAKKRIISLTALLFFTNITAFGQEETQVTTGLKDGHTIVIVKEPNKKEYWHYAAGCKMLTVTIESPTRCKKCDTESQQEEAKKKAEADKKRAENKAKEKNGNTTVTDPTNTEINRSGTERNTNNSNTTSTTNPYMNKVNAYNAKMRADAQALDNAADQTMNAWGNELAKGKNADFVSTAKPLVGEFAKQGNATAAYGTVGVAVGAQVISMIGSGKSREERLKERGEYEMKEHFRAIIKGDDQAAFKHSIDDINNNGDNSDAYCQAGIFSLYNTYDIKEIINMHGRILESNAQAAYPFLEKSSEIIQRKDLQKLFYHPYFELGYLTFLGIGTSRNYQEAYKYFENGILRGAKDGNTEYPSCHYYLGYLKLVGIGTQKSEKEAFKHFEKATGYYHPEGKPIISAANFALGYMSYYGIGTSQNTKKALAYFEKSVKQKNINAIILLEQMLNNNEFDKKEAEKIKIICSKNKKKAEYNGFTNTTFTNDF
ncbi:Sel1 repeat-containing protein [Sinomicrobium oceani]|uniref:Sel1 repeat-containing protein n=1 Tax=Sinomicrobium oceani TaxID=1150368 RepID=A0A1K1PYA2_9FLAO|nr:tetratricopeptide repeat protein [Sinomicrobium oceani]SFW52624.1 Sel1 repeat-containing protein [Sinomicrobium oceani]